MKILYNPACSKCRTALDEIEERGTECDVIEYLKAPLDRAELTRLVGQLDGEPGDLVRRDKRFAELGLSDADCRTPAQVVDLLFDHPELMQRPVIIRDGRAKIARTPEALRDALD